MTSWPTGAPGHEVSAKGGAKDPVFTTQPDAEAQQTPSPETIHADGHPKKAMLNPRARPGLWGRSPLQDAFGTVCIASDRRRPASGRPQPMMRSGSLGASNHLIDHLGQGIRQRTEWKSQPRC